VRKTFPPLDPSWFNTSSTMAGCRPPLWNWRTRTWAPGPLRIWNSGGKKTECAHHCSAPSTAPVLAPGAAASRLISERSKV